MVMICRSYQKIGFQQEIGMKGSCLKTPGVLGELRNAREHIECYEHFIDNDFVELIAMETNICAATNFSKNSTGQNG